MFLVLYILPILYYIFIISGIIFILDIISLIVLSVLKRNNEKKIAANILWVSMTATFLSVGLFVMLFVYTSYEKEYLKIAVTATISIDNEGNGLYFRHSNRGQFLKNPMLYNFANGKTTRYEVDEYVSQIVVSEDNSTAIIVTEKNILAYNLNNSTKDILYNVEKVFVTDLAFSTDEKKIAFVQIPTPSYPNPQINNFVFCDLSTKEITAIDYDEKKYGKSITKPTCANNDTMAFASDDNIMLYDFKTKKVRFLTKGLEPKISKNGKYIVYISKNNDEITNVYRYDIANNEYEPVSYNSILSATTKQYGDMSEFVHNYYFMLNGVDISDDGNIIAYIEVEEGLQTIEESPEVEDKIIKNNPNIIRHENTQKKIITKKICYYNFNDTTTTKFDAFPLEKKSNNMLPVTTLSLSGNGRYLMFTGDGFFKENETENLINVYIKDLQTGELTLLSDTKSTWFSPKIRLKV